MQKNQKKIEYLFVALLFLFGLYYYVFRILGFDLSYTPGDFGDSRFINYVLEHGYKWLRGIEPDFWRANFMYPLKNNIAISDSMAGSLPIYALFRFTGFDVERSYQLWWLSCCLLNFWCCYFAFKKIGFDPFLSAIGAYAFAFGINNFNQFVHLQFNCKFFVPVAIAALYSFLNDHKIKQFNLLVLSVVLQFYCSAYIAIFLLLFILSFSVFYLYFKNKWQAFKESLNKKQAIKITASLIIGLLFMLLLAIPYYQMSKQTGHQHYENIVFAIPGFFSYFLPNESSLTWDLLKDSPAKEYPIWYLHDLFPGIFCYLGLLISFIHLIYCVIKKQKINYLTVSLLLVSIGFILFFSRTQSNHSLFKFIQPIPGFSSMRLTSRYLIVLTFAFIWLSLFYFNKLKRERTIWLSLVLAFLIVGDNLFDPNRISRTLVQKRIERTENMCRLIKQNNTANNKIIAVLNPSDEPQHQVDVMLATQKLNLYTLNGYSSTCYAELCSAYEDPEHKKLSEWLEKYYIEESKVTFINNQ